MRVYLRNNGNPAVPEENRRDYRLPGWHTAIPLGDRLEITDDILGFMARPTGPGQALLFAEFVAGVQNRGRGEWLSVETEEAQPTSPEIDEKPRRSGKTKTSNTTGDAGQGDTE